jgi:hypothetical protein
MVQSTSRNERNPDVDPFENVSASSVKNLSSWTSCSQVARMKIGLLQRLNQYTEDCNPLFHTLKELMG